MQKYKEFLKGGALKSKKIHSRIPFRAHADAKPISPPHILYPELADMYPELMDMYPKLADIYPKLADKENPAAITVKERQLLALIGRCCIRGNGFFV